MVDRFMEDKTKRVDVDITGARSKKTSLPLGFVARAVGWTLKSLLRLVKLHRSIVRKAWFILVFASRWRYSTLTITTLVK